METKFFTKMWNFLFGKEPKEGNSEVLGLCLDPNERRKFEKLQVYFQDLTLADLGETEDPDDLIRDVETTDRMLMRIFIRKYLMPLRKRPRELLEPTQELFTTLEEGVTVFAAGMMIASDFASVSSQRITITKLHAMIIEYNSPVRFINISKNNLISTDMRYVAAMVEDLNDKKLIAASGLIVDLSLNKIQGIKGCEEVEDAITKITSCDMVQYLDLRINPCVSVDKRNFFQKLTSDSPTARKLIWVNEVHLPTYNWRSMVSESVIKVVLDIHKEYFSWYSRNS